MGRMSKAIKDMEKARAAKRMQAPKVDPNKTCPSCFADVGAMTKRERQNHLNRCM